MLGLERRGVSSWILDLGAGVRRPWNDVRKGLVAGHVVLEPRVCFVCGLSAHHSLSTLLTTLNSLVKGHQLLHVGHLSQ